jgi:hypothetical protein
VKRWLNQSALPDPVVAITRDQSVSVPLSQHFDLPTSPTKALGLRDQQLSREVWMERPVVSHPPD